MLRTERDPEHGREGIRVFGPAFIKNADFAAEGRVAGPENPMDFWAVRGVL
jgi:hypothetical protein